MDVQRLPDAAAFLDATESLRMREPILTNVAGSIAQSVVNGRRYESALWLVVRDEGDVVGCALRTPPYKAVLSPMPAGAAASLGRWLAVNDPDLPGCSGPEPVVSAVAEAMGRGVMVRMRDVARVLDQLPASNEARPVRGAGTPAGTGDLHLIVEWLVAFEIEAGLQRFADLQHAQALVDDRRLWLWRVGQEPVALGGHAPLVSTPAGTIGRIGPIYTPVQHRRRGYGSAITRAVAEALQDRCDRIMLFADAGNPESNSIYAALGFAVAGGIVEADLTS